MLIVSLCLSYFHILFRAPLWWACELRGNSHSKMLPRWELRYSKLAPILRQFILMCMVFTLSSSCFLNSCPYRRYGRALQCASCGKFLFLFVGNFVYLFMAVILCSSLFWVEISWNIYYLLRMQSDAICWIHFSKLKTIANTLEFIRELYEILWRI